MSKCGSWSKKSAKPCLRERASTKPPRSQLFACRAGDRRARLAPAGHCEHRTRSPKGRRRERPGPDWVCGHAQVACIFSWETKLPKEMLMNYYCIFISQIYAALVISPTLSSWRSDHFA